MKIIYCRLSNEDYRQYILYCSLYKVELFFINGNILLKKIKIYVHINLIIKNNLNLISYFINGKLYLITWYFLYYSFKNIF